MSEEHAQTEEPSPSVVSVRAKDDYVHYLRIREELKERFGATPGEIAMWIWQSSTDGGLDAFLGSEDFENPQQFRYDYDLQPDLDYIRPLMSCYFRRTEVDAFVPRERFITHRQLIDRWASRIGEKDAMDLLKAKAVAHEIQGMHPICGAPKPWGIDSNDPRWPEIETGMFPLDQVEAVEGACFPNQPEIQARPIPVSNNQIYPLNPDHLTDEAKQTILRQREAHHRFVNSEEGKQFWNLIGKESEIKSEIERVTSLPEPVPSERESKHRQLDELRQQLTSIQRELEGEVGRPPNETSEARVLRLRKRRADLISQGNRRFNKKIAEEEGISTSRVKEILKGGVEKESTSNPTSKPSPIGRIVRGK